MRTIVTKNPWTAHSKGISSFAGQREFMDKMSYRSFHLCVARGDIPSFPLGRSG